MQPMLLRKQREDHGVWKGDIGQLFQKVGLLVVSTLTENIPERKRGGEAEHTENPTTTTKPHAKKGRKGLDPKDPTPVGRKVGTKQ